MAEGAQRPLCGSVKASSQPSVRGKALHSKRILQGKNKHAAFAWRKLWKWAARRTGQRNALLHAYPGGGGIFWKHKFEQAAVQRKAAKPFSFRRRKVNSNIQRQTSAAWRNAQPPARAHAAKSAANGDRRAKLCRKRAKCSEQPPVHPDGFAERAAEKIMQAHPGIAGIGKQGCTLHVKKRESL